MKLIKYSRAVIIIFVIFAFLAGMYVYSTQSISFISIPFEKKNTKENLQSSHEKTAKCPNVLIRNGNMLLLYNTTDTHDEIPLQFNNLDEYIQHVHDERAKGKFCEVLFLQKENDAQGNDVYRARPSPFNTQGGLNPVNVPTTPNEVITGRTPISYPPALPLLDANRTHTPYNSNNYPGFDPYGQQQGQFSQLDEIHVATGKQNQSDNPMDPNWGGVAVSQAAVESGKYLKNNVYPANYSTSGGTQFFPGLFNSVIPDPPNVMGHRQG